MLPADLDTVTRSYHRCMSSDGFLDTFYDRFLASSAEIAEKFRGTDFAHQKLMLRESLLLMVMFNKAPDVVNSEMEKLAERHSRRGADIPAPMYTLWLDALCEAIEIHDPECTPAIAANWRAA